MASEPEEASTPAGIPGDSQEEDGSRTSSPPLPVGSDDAVGSPAQPPERESTEEAGPGGPDFVPPLPAGDGPGQALILHGTGASSDSDSDDYSTSSDEEPDESQLPPGPIDPSRCSATGPGFSGGSSGMPVKMVITAKDSAGRRIRDGGAYVLVTLDKPAPTGSVVVARAEVTDHGDGTYTALYTCPSKGSYQVSLPGWARASGRLARHGSGCLCCGCACLGGGTSGRMVGHGDCRPALAPRALIPNHT